MVNLTITGSTTAGQLAEQFRKELGGALRIFDGRSRAGDGVTLASIGARKCTVSVSPEATTVEQFEKAMLDQANLKVRVYTADQWVAVLPGILLSLLPKLPKAATKAKLEPFLTASAGAGAAPAPTPATPRAAAPAPATPRASAPAPTPAAAPTPPPATPRASRPATSRASSAAIKPDPAIREKVIKIIAEKTKQPIDKVVDSAKIGADLKYNWEPNVGHITDGRIKNWDVAVSKGAVVWRIEPQYGNFSYLFKEGLKMEFLNIEETLKKNASNITVGDLIKIAEAYSILAQQIKSAAEDVESRVKLALCVGLRVSPLDEAVKDTAIVKERKGDVQSSLDYRLGQYSWSLSSIWDNNANPSVTDIVEEAKRRAKLQKDLAKDTTLVRPLVVKSIQKTAKVLPSSIVDSATLKDLGLGCWECSYPLNDRLKEQLQQPSLYKPLNKSYDTLTVADLVKMCESHAKLRKELIASPDNVRANVIKAIALVGSTAPSEISDSATLKDIGLSCWDCSYPLNDRLKEQLQQPSLYKPLNKSYDTLTVADLVKMCESHAKLRKELIATPDNVRANVIKAIALVGSIAPLSIVDSAKLKDLGLSSYDCAWTLNERLMQMLHIPSINTSLSKAYDTLTVGQLIADCEALVEQ